MNDLEICYLPAQWRRLESARLSASVCVVIDVIRATSTLLAALAAGARGVRPVASVEEAFAWKERLPGALLAGERGGQALPGFDRGNSPREMTSDVVQGRELILTTTNGTQALAACQGARAVLTAAFLNLDAVAARLRQLGPPWIVLCAGYEGDFGLDDAVVAGALAEALEQESAFVPLYRAVRHDLAGMLLGCNAGQELVKVGLEADLPICAELNRFAIVPTLDDGGVLRAS
jgi:2-phosphosulfolactate phosphatase